MKIKNMLDSSKIYISDPDGMSWIDWWRKQTGSKRTTCCVKNCGEIAEGAHVVEVDKKEPVYILPLCHNHNMKENWTLNVLDESLLVHCPDRYRQDKQ